MITEAMYQDRVREVLDLTMENDRLRMDNDRLRKVVIATALKTTAVGTHPYKPHPKWPWFCKDCGYSKHEHLQHGPQPAPIDGEAKNDG